MNLFGVKTCDLINELRKREGVETNAIGPSAFVQIKADGPAIVLAVTD